MLKDCSIIESLKDTNIMMLWRKPLICDISRGAENGKLQLERHQGRALLNELAQCHQFVTNNKISTSRTLSHICYHSSRFSRFNILGRMAPRQTLLHHIDWHLTDQQVPVLRSLKGQLPGRKPTVKWTENHLLSTTSSFSTFKLYSTIPRLMQHTINKVTMVWQTEVSHCNINLSRSAVSGLVKRMGRTQHLLQHLLT